MSRQWCAVQQLLSRTADPEWQILQATAGLKGTHTPYARAAWKFLSAVGFINWGSSASMQDRVDEPAKKGKVIVVGAGLAGRIPRMSRWIVQMNHPDKHVHEPLCS